MLSHDLQCISVGLVFMFGCISAVLIFWYLPSFTSVIFWNGSKMRWKWSNQV